MHTHMFKLGGMWKTKSGVEYTAKAFNHQDRKKMKGTGWFDTLEKALSGPAEVKEVKVLITGSEQLKEYLREQITNLGGSFDKRSGIEKLEDQLEELKNGDSNQD